MNTLKKKIIFDTDIGNDSDDVVALVMLAKAHLRGDIELLGVSVSSQMEGALCARAILGNYSLKDISVSCFDKNWHRLDAYGYQVAHKFPALSEPNRPIPNAAKELRRLIAEHPGVELVITGTFDNLDALLHTAPDEYSGLDGINLVAQNVSKLSAMAGSFSHQTGLLATGSMKDNHGRAVPKPEWNIYGNGDAARYVISHWPTEIVFLPWELGVDVITGASLAALGDKNPVGAAIIAYGAVNGRASWDPMTTYYAICGTQGWVELSKPGFVTVDADNITHFKETPKGKHYFLTKLTLPYADVAKRVESYL